MSRKVRILLIAAVILALLALIFQDHIHALWYQINRPEPYLPDLVSRQ